MAQLQLDRQIGQSTNIVKAAHPVHSKQQDQKLGWSQQIAAVWRPESSDARGQSYLYGALSVTELAHGGQKSA